MTARNNKIYSKIFVSVCIALMAIPISFAQELHNSGDTLPNPYSNQVITTPFAQTDFSAITAPATVITSDQLSKYPTADLREALSGLIPSGVVFNSGYGPGQSNIQLNVRDMDYAIIVDGMQRNVFDMDINEIETISVLRGMTAHALYGSAAKNGAIVVTTKKGYAGKDQIIFNVEYGFKEAVHMPQWLNAYEYAKLYNQARQNDGLAPRYSEESLQGYQEGHNRLKYPDEDLYGELFNNTMNFTKANLSFGGGDSTTQYFAYLGYTGEGKGLMKIKDNTYDRINLRGRVDVALSKSIKLNMNVATVLGIRSELPNQPQMWTAVSSYAPNVYPIRIKEDTMGINPVYPFNPVAEQTFKGDIDELSRTVQANFGLDFDLRKITQGLKLELKGMFDIYDYQQITDRAGLQYALYQPVFSVSDSLGEQMTLTPYGIDVPAAGANISATDYFQQVASTANLAYNRHFGIHRIGANAVYFVQKRKKRGTAIENNLQNMGFLVNYALKEKYFADLSLSYTGDMNLSKVNRYKMFPSLGLGWIVSKEAFMKSLEAIDYLKFRASYGTMGTYDTYQSFLFRTEWERGPFGAFFGSAGGNNETISTTYLSQYGNPDLTWGTIHELDIGLEAVALNSHLRLQIDYYNMVKEGIIATALIPDVIGIPNYYDNINKNRYFGMDGNIIWNSGAGDLSYSIGINYGFNSSEVLTYNEPKNKYEWMNRTGERVGTIYGFEAIGLFANEEDIQSSPQQYMGAVTPGSIKYKNLNPEDDDFVEAKTDEKAIGNPTPLYKFGAPISIKYKKLQLYAMVVGYFGRDINVVNHPYFHASGEQKYSLYVQQNAWASGGENPILTTSASANDNLTSTHWIEDGSFVKLKNLELSYTLSELNAGSKYPLEAILFVRGANLFTLSPFDTLDPENPYGGISTFATMRTFTGGMKFRF